MSEQKKSYSTQEQGDGEFRNIWMVTSPHWVPVFIMMSAVISLAPFIVGFFFGLTVASNIVFGIYALVSGLAADYILKRWFRIRLVVWQKPVIPLWIFWCMLCLYVIVAQPLG